MILNGTSPRFVHTYNLADNHDTHVASALRVIEALRRLPATERPQILYGREVWRSLDWLLDADKIPFDLSLHENLQAALLGVFDSQISGGKQYDLASMGRRKANATCFESDGVDTARGIYFAMDLAPLIEDDKKPINDVVQEYIARFGRDVAERHIRLTE